MDNVRPDLAIYLGLNIIFIVFSPSRDAFVGNKGLASAVSVCEEEILTVGLNSLIDYSTKGLVLSVIHLVTSRELDNHGFLDSLDPGLEVISFIDFTECSFGDALADLVSVIEDKPSELMNDGHLAMFLEHPLYC